MGDKVLSVYLWTPKRRVPSCAQFCQAKAVTCLFLGRTASLRRVHHQRHTLCHAARQHKAGVGAVAILIADREELPVE